MYDRFSRWWFDSPHFLLINSRQIALSNISYACRVTILTTRLSCNYKEKYIGDVSVEYHWTEETERSRWFASVLLFPLHRIYRTYFQHAWFCAVRLDFYCINNNFQITHSRRAAIKHRYENDNAALANDRWIDLLFKKEKRKEQRKGKM